MNLKIYNLFPRYFRGIKDWYAIVDRAKKMGFNAIYLNPFLKTGNSNSIYSIVDYYQFDEQIDIGLSNEEKFKKLSCFIDYCKEQNLMLIFDLVINHSSIDSPLIYEHPEWYLWSENEVEKAKTKTIEGYDVIWHDCAKFDYSNANSGLWEYIEQVVLYYMELGFIGFRCDVACHISSIYWKYLISKVKSLNSDVFFIGEAFLASDLEIMALADAGFDYIFNSSCWWNYCDSWLLENNEFTRKFLNTISFPENHDTFRCMKTEGEHRQAVIQRLFMTAFLSSGFMMLCGFEYGFTEKPNVCTTTPKEWIEPKMDISLEIQKLLQFRDCTSVLQKDGILKRISCENPEISIIKKSVGNMTAWFIFNLSIEPICLSSKNLSIYSEIFSNKTSSIVLNGKESHCQICVEPLELLKNCSPFLIGKQRFLYRNYEMESLIENGIRIQPMYVGICGSDRAEYRRDIPYYWRPSYTGGHEIVGIVVQTSLYSKWRIGDYIIYRHPRTGQGIVQGGGFSNFVDIKEDCAVQIELKNNLYKIVLAEPLACVCHALNRVKLGKKIAIVGNGTIALLMERMIRCNFSYDKLFVLYRHSDVVRHLDNCTIAMDSRKFYEKDNLFFDTIFECSGDAETIRMLQPCLNTGGSLVVMGIYKEFNQIDSSTVMFQEQQMIGSFLYTEEDFQNAINLIQMDKIVVDDILEVVPIEMLEYEFANPRVDGTKVILKHH